MMRASVFVRAVLWTALIAALPHTARADERAPLDAVLTGLQAGEVLAPGEILRATLELSSEVEIVVSGVGVSSGRDAQGQLHWESLLVNTPTDILLEPGVPQVFDVELIANDPLEPVDIVFEAGGKIESFRFFAVDPTRNLVAQILPPGLDAIGAPVADRSPALGEDPEIDLLVTPDPYEFPTAAALSDLEVDPRFDDETDASQKSFFIQVRGELWTLRAGGALVRVDGATIYVYDADSGEDDLLGIGVTKADGTFDFPVLRGNESAPDVYLVVVSANAMISVEFQTLTGATAGAPPAWRFNTAVRANQGGAAVDFGVVTPPTPLPFVLDLNAAFYMHSIMTKGWRYLTGLGYTSALDDLKVRWPADVDVPFYRRHTKTIHMNIARQWREDTMIHEFGHHWVNQYAQADSPDYCNPGGYQDSGGDCGHNVWCAENEKVAWSEGFANFLANMTIDWIRANYHGTNFNRNVETIAQCGQAGFVTDPYKTENIFAAFLRDLADSQTDADFAFANAGVDRTNQGVGKVLQTAMSSFAPRSSNAFLTAHVALNTDLGTDLWFTAANNGFDYDGTPPSTPTNLTSSSHPQFSSSPDATVELTWDPSTDLISGVRRYYVLVSPDGGYPYPGTATLTTSTSFTTPELDPGTYYATVLAEDWAERQSAGYAVHGPFTISQPDPPEFAVSAGPLWPEPIVPRKTADTTTLSAPLPNFLSGDQGQTWFNYRVENFGDLPNPFLIVNKLWLDGVETVINTVSNIAPINGGSSRVFVNQGPFTVRGGRHAIEVLTDATELMPETNEVNNRARRQFIWAPSILVSTPVDRVAPPDPTAGVNTATPFYSPNCDGLGYIASSTAPFWGLAAIPDAVGDDYDLRSHPHTTGPQDGFSLFGILASSSRGAGALDAVVTNTALTSQFQVDVGVRATVARSARALGGYRATPVSSTQIPTGVPTQVTLASDEFVSLHHFTLDPSFGTTFATLRVTTDAPGDQPLWVAIIEPDVAEFGLDQANLGARADRDAVATLDFTFTQPLHGLVLYRDRVAGRSMNDPVTATITVQPTPANFVAPGNVAGWAAPVVPTFGAPGTPTNVPAPTSLVGDVNNTYLNVAIANDGPNPGVPLEFVSYVDGASAQGAQTSGIVGAGTLLRNFSTPITVRGGRHTLWARYDVADLVSESNEDDNRWGAQWVWEPSILAVGSAGDFAAPGNPIGGFDAVVESQGTNFYLNSVGFRDAAPVPSGDDGHWHGVAVMPGDSSDVDLRLHEVETGVTNGFRDVLAASNWGMGSGDYVLTNFRATSSKPMDVGVVGVSGSETFMAQAVRSTFLGVEPDALYGDFTLLEREFLALHEVELQAGPRRIDLVEVSGNIDWGITLHRADLPYHAKSLTADSPSQWDGGPGATETLVVDVPEDGRYCIAVWKARSSDAMRDGTYRLDFSSQPVDVPSVGDVARTRIQSVQPNPFNPRTVVGFDLQHAGRVSMRIYDIRGGLVRTLVDEVAAAGRHGATWDGTDERGHRVASGVYFARLDASGVRDIAKLLLVK